MIFEPFPIRFKYQSNILNMLSLFRTNSQNADFMGLVKLLDGGLAVTDGEDHAFYNKFNKIDSIKYVTVAYENGQAVGCGAIKEFAQDTMEVKRMFVSEPHRGKGIAGKIIAELETWAAELGYSKCVLETGKRQVEAVALYTKCGYTIIPNYGQYIGMDNSLCFEKEL